MNSRNAPAWPTSSESVVREYIDRLARQESSAFDLVAEDFVQHAAAAQGRDGLRQLAQVLEHDLSRPSIHILHVVASGDLVLVHLILTGVHGGSTMPLLHGISISGATVSWTFMHLLRVHDGLITEHWSCQDDLGLLEQLGAWSTREKPRTFA